MKTNELSEANRHIAFLKKEIETVKNSNPELLRLRNENKRLS